MSEAVGESGIKEGKEDGCEMSVRAGRKPMLIGERTHTAFGMCVDL